MIPYLDEAEVTITSSDPSTVSRSRSGRKVSRNLEQQRWSLAVAWPSYLDEKTLPLEIALDAMKGQSMTASIVHPTRSYHGNAPGPWTVTSAIAAGENDIEMSGTGSLTIGHLVRFSSHSKVYRVMSVDGHTVTVFPALRKSLLRSEFITTQAVPISVTRTEDDISYKTTGPLTAIAATFEEML